MLRCLALLLAPFLLACRAPARATPAPVAITAAELAEALRPGGRFITYRGDGTPLGDSLARIASSAATELEGGDFRLGDRLLRYAVWRGWPLAQAASTGDLLDLLNLTPDPAGWLRLLEALEARRAALEWLPEARLRLQRRLGAVGPTRREGESGPVRAV